MEVFSLIVDSYGSLCCNWPFCIHPHHLSTLGMSPSFLVLSYLTCTALYFPINNNLIDVVIKMLSSQIYSDEVLISTYEWWFLL